MAHTKPELGMLSVARKLIKDVAHLLRPMSFCKNTYLPTSCPINKQHVFDSQGILMV
jgi:hypothetical protein